MPSPFPGMNPFLERAETWSGFHLQLIVGIQFQLVAQLDGYNVQLGARRYFHPAANPGDFPYTERRPFVTVRHRQSSELVTVIELLSPTSKCAGPHREEYLSARAELLASPIHFVEIDLLRAGPRMPSAELPACDYCALVRRAGARGRRARVAFARSVSRNRRTASRRRTRCDSEPARRSGPPVRWCGL
jgi:Protein of unknown function (DUF4058)